MTDETKNEFTPNGGTSETQAEAGAVDRLTAELESVRLEAADWREKYLRLLAEFDNFRKRVRQDMDLQRALTTESLLAAILPIVDDLDRMLATNTDVEDPYRRGAELIRGKLQSFLESRNVHRVECLGAPFDPEAHDALLMRPTTDFPSGTVLEVIVPAYRLGDRVIRHAKVVVSESAESSNTGQASEI